MLLAKFVLFPVGSETKKFLILIQETDVSLQMYFLQTFFLVDWMAFSMMNAFIIPTFQFSGDFDWKL